MMPPQNGPQFGYVYAPPQGYGPAHPDGQYGAMGYGPMPARAEGAILDYPVHGSPLPPLCCKCGTQHGLKARMQTLVYINPIAWLGALGGLLPLALMIAFLQKRVQIMLPICQTCDRRWTHGSVFRGLSFVAPFVLGPVVGALIGLFTTSDTAFAAGILASFALLIAIPIAVVKLVSEPRAIVAKKIDDHRAKLKGVHPDLLRALG